MTDLDPQVIQLAFPGLEWLAAAGIGWLLNRGNNAAASGAHTRQLESEDARHQASLDHDWRMAQLRRDEYRNYLAEERAREESFRGRKADAFRSLGGLPGLGGFDMGQLAYSSTGSTPPPMVAGGGGGMLPVTSRGGEIMGQMGQGGGLTAMDIMQIARGVGPGGPSTLPQNQSGMIPSSQVTPRTTPGQPGYRPGTGRGFV